MDHLASKRLVLTALYLCGAISAFAGPGKETILDDVRLDADNIFRNSQLPGSDSTLSRSAVTGNHVQFSGVDVQGAPGVSISPHAGYEGFTTDGEIAGLGKETIVGGSDADFISHEIEIRIRSMALSEGQKQRPAIPRAHKAADDFAPMRGNQQSRYLKPSIIFEQQSIS